MISDERLEDIVIGDAAFLEHEEIAEMSKELLALRKAEKIHQVEYRLSQVTTWVDVKKEDYDKAGDNVRKRVIIIDKEVNRRA